VRDALQHGLVLDIIVLLHADGQYAPEILPEIVAPIVDGEADAVFGSRMMVPGSARAGGMPLYKYVGNRILTASENRILGTSLSEFHSGYRAYNVHTLSELDLSATSDGFNFDTQIIIALHSHGKKIVEIPIPTYYGDEICYVNGMQYAADVVADVAVYRLAKMGFTPGELAQVGDEYDLKESEGSSHSVILDLMDSYPSSRVLDVGCSGQPRVGPLAAASRGMAAAASGAHGTDGLHGVEPALRRQNGRGVRADGRRSGAQAERIPGEPGCVRRTRPGDHECRAAAGRAAG